MTENEKSSVGISEMALRYVEITNEVADAEAKLKAVEKLAKDYASDLLITMENCDRQNVAVEDMMGARWIVEQAHSTSLSIPALERPDVVALLLRLGGKARDLVDLDFNSSTLKSMINDGTVNGNLLKFLQKPRDKGPFLKPVVKLSARKAKVGEK